MDNTFFKRFGKHSHKRNPTDLLAPCIPINKSIKPTQIYQDHDPNPSPFLDKKTAQLPKIINHKSNLSESVLSDWYLSQDSRNRFPYDSLSPVKNRYSDLSLCNQGNESFGARSHNSNKNNHDFRSFSPIYNSRESSQKLFKVSRVESPPPKSYTPTWDKSINSSAKMSQASRNGTAETPEKKFQYKPYAFDGCLKLRPEKYYLIGGSGPCNVSIENQKSKIASKEKAEGYCRLSREFRKGLAM
ncbi:unnamed protein product [Blepharisma stoltei]|uniref:Uncharacterized protein n=1 Tax=Blepharisma stoltei TaxID=1481888 RepID=A0AAU9K0W1_9CILI|nr:unnamed protein product [Blepharisma stoltei]